MTVYKIVDSMRFQPPTSSGGAPEASAAGAVRKSRVRVAFPVPDARSLLGNLAAQYSRICTFHDDAIVFRDFPEDESAQIKLHNEFMRSARVSLQEVSRARVLFLRKRPAPGRAGPPRARQRVLEAEEPAGAAAGVENREDGA